MHRSPYQQIIEWNARRGEHRRLGQELAAQIEKLRAEVSTIAGLAPMHLQFVPIRLVTILEVFLREVIAELVDGDEATFQRAEKLVKGAKIDLTFAAHVNRRELTIGDFIAHSVSLNGIDGILAILDTLIPGFAHKLKAAHPRWSEESDDWPLPPIVTNYNAMMVALSRLFEVRHVLTHELPADPVFDLSDLTAFIDAARTFVDGVDWAIVEVLHGSVPRTQTAMNVAAGDKLRGEEEELNALLERVAALPGMDASMLRDAHAAWSDFADQHAALIASQVEGGSMYPLVWAGERSALVQDRIIQLKGVIEGWMD